MVARSILVFVATGLVGPLIGWVMWPPGPTESSLANFLYDLILLLWPAQPLAVMEASPGTPAAAAIAVGANVLVFGIAGMIAGCVARRPAYLVALYFIACLLVLLVELWIGGFSLANVSPAPLLVALLVYAVPFFSVMRMANRFSRRNA